MNYKEAREYLAMIASGGSCLGLERIRSLLKELGDPQDKLKFIHIAGTNGKGSVMAFLEQVLIEAGYRTGRYLSPVLFSYEEKIRVNGVCITKDALAQYTARIKNAMDLLAERGKELPTIFEVETVLSFLFFADEGCDLVLLETGMGGREDATNVVTTTVLEIISSLSMDHMQYLGTDIGQIAWHKAGIIKPHTRVVSARQQMAAQAVLAQECKLREAELSFVSSVRMRDVVYGLYEQQLSYGIHENIVFHLPGTFQIGNAALALEAIDALIQMGYLIPEDKIRKGFEEARWPGRFEILHEKPMVIMDGAHNADAAAALRSCLETYFHGKRIYYIFGVFSDKEYDKIIDATADLAEYIFTVETKNNARALPSEDLAQAVRLVNPNVESVKDVSKALSKALAIAEEEDVVILFGSLSWLWEAKRFFNERDKGNHDK